MRNFRWNRAEQLSFLVLILSVIALKTLSFKLWSREGRRPSAATEVVAGSLSKPVVEVVAVEAPPEAMVEEVAIDELAGEAETGEAGKESVPAAGMAAGKRGEQRGGNSGRMGKETRRPVRIDLNRVDSVALVEVRGIGPYTASRILRYRRQLGGFVRLEQLDEIKGLYPENLTVLKSQALIDTSAIQRLSVNGSPVEALAAHPYLSWRQARALDGLRRRRGRIRTISDLSFLEEFDSADLARLAPYLQW